MGWVVNATPIRFTPGEDPVPIEEAGWTPGPVRTVAKILAPTGILTRTAITYNGS